MHAVRCAVYAVRVPPHREMGGGELGGYQSTEPLLGGGVGVLTTEPPPPPQGHKVKFDVVWILRVVAGTTHHMQRADPVGHSSGWWSFTTGG